MTALRVLREAAELALKALCEEQAAYEDPLYHVDEAIKALRAALAHPPESDALSRLASLADTVAAAVRNTCSMPHPNIGLDTDLAPYIWSLSFEANAQKKRADALAHPPEGAQPEPAVPLSAALAMLPTDRHSVDVQWVAFRLRSLAEGAQPLPAADAIPEGTMVRDSKTLDYDTPLYTHSRAEAPVGPAFVHLLAEFERVRNRHWMHWDSIDQSASGQAILEARAALAAAQEKSVQPRVVGTSIPDERQP